MAAAHGAVLVTGGAGYIGSHAVLALRDRGWPVVVVDNLTTGLRALLPPDVMLIEADCGDTSCIRALLKTEEISAVMHFAASTVVPESVSDPMKYYLNNTVTTARLIDVCVEAGVDAFIYSSTAAVYGTPDVPLVSEHVPTKAISPYGKCKLMGEEMLGDVATAHSMRYMALRYFNVAGADPQGRSGQSTLAATHLIKAACEVASGKRPYLEIYGDDYDTPDGTCIRDYIHVTDLVDAHISALDHLVAGGNSDIINCGYGHGHSVHEVVDAVRAIFGVDFETRISPRRPGDMATLVCNSDRLRETLGWQPRYDDMSEIVRTACAWERQLNSDDVTSPLDSLSAAHSLRQAAER
jgi:UDP-glucose 4-epimerase